MKDFENVYINRNVDYCNQYISFLPSSPTSTATYAPNNLRERGVRFSRHGRVLFNKYYEFTIVKEIALF